MSYEFESRVRYSEVDELGNITAANDKSDKSQTPVESENQQDQSKE